MKPIPAIDENDEFVEATLRGGAKRAIATLDNGCGCIIGVLGYWWNLDGSSPQPNSRGWDLIDLPAVRERVERAAKMRENALQHAADVIQQDIAAQYGVCERPRDPRLRPSFAEALEREIANDLSRVDRNPNRPVTPAMLYDWLLSARAASGE